MFKHMFTMVVKTITVTEGAYASIKKLKRGDESFSDLFVRLSSEKKSTGRSILGILKDTGTDAETLLKKSKELRERADKDWEKRKHVFARQFSGNRNGETREKK